MGYLEGDFPVFSVPSNLIRLFAKKKKSNTFLVNS